MLMFIPIIDDPYYAKIAAAGCGKLVVPLPGVSATAEGKLLKEIDIIIGHTCALVY